LAVIIKEHIEKSKTSIIYHPFVDDHGLKASRLRQTYRELGIDIRRAKIAITARPRADESFPRALGGWKI